MILWSNGSIDIVDINAIASIRIYNHVTHAKVNVNMIDKLRIQFEFYNTTEIYKLLPTIKHAQKLGYDVIIDLVNSKILETQNGLIPKPVSRKNSA